MSTHSKPNSWVAKDDVASSQLSIALQVNPAPLTVSVAGASPVLGSLEFVITNPTSAPIVVNSIAFQFQVGPNSSDLTPTTAGIETAVSDSTDWMVQSPGTITSGTATYTLQPQTGSSVSIAPHASVVVELINFQTGQNPGNTVVTVKETTPSGPAFSTFQVTTFPSGFYFNGLVATVPNGSQLVPVAQVPATTQVTLVWNSSIISLSSFQIFYSDASQTQRSATPTDTGQWLSPPLTSDTVFTVVVTVSLAGGAPLVAATTTTVAVQNPSLIAASITAGQATVNSSLGVGGSMSVSGPANLNGGATIAGGATVSGPANLTGGASIQGNANLNGVLIGNSGIGGSAGRIQGYGTASNAVFAFKFDNANFGDTPGAIQVWNESAGVFKTFIIDHPLEPAKYLVHATVEGPEAAVFYRGTATLTDGAAQVQLPRYFEALTDPDSVTVQLTALDGFDRLCVETVEGRKVRNGVFRVRSENPGSGQRFDWEVKATRRDAPALETEPDRSSIGVGGVGPYRFTMRPN